VRRAIDENSGMELTASFGRSLDEIETTGRDAYAGSGGKVVFVKGLRYEAWYLLSQPVIDDWVRQQDARGANGEALLGTARGLVAKYSARWAPDRE
jgi:hypothetical protein